METFASDASDPNPECGSQGWRFALSAVDPGLQLGMLTHSFVLLENKRR